MNGSVLQFEAIGTTWRITTTSRISSKVQKAVYDRIASFDKTYSRFRKDSLVSTMAKHAGTYIFPDDAKQLFFLYKKLYDITEGLVTPLIGQLLSDAGYDASYSLQQKTLHNTPSWDDTIAYQFPELLVKKPVLLDIGAAGKGYLIDLVGNVLQASEIATYTINAGGDIVYKNQEGKKLRIGLEHPNDSKKVIGLAEIANESICGSAGNRRKWGIFHHIMNPKSKTSVEDILSVWVIAKTGLLADGLATALFFVHPEKLQETFVFHYCILNKDYSINISPNFPGQFY